MFPHCNSSPRHQPGQANANVKVVVRVRPLNEAEHSEKYHVVTEAISDHMLVFDPKIQSTPGFLLMNQRDINRRRFKDLKYAFDYVFGPSATNKDVFEQTTKGIVSGVLNGYNCSVFAYGATGAGKTHTMLGSDREPGVIYYTMIDLYRRINEQKDENMFDVAVSYSEVYNEQVRDLLMPRGNLPIREDRNIGVIIAGLSLHKPKTADELLHMLQFGNKNRTQHPTDANAESSRSHAVFQVFVNQREKSASVSTEVRMAKMCLVDLAGSERANHSTNCGARFREGANINRSLLALGNVINALADNKFKGHIPYRDSKLTRLLKDSLGGNCQTVMIAAVSPSSRSFEDTYNTLRYADRAKHIRADLKKNVMSIDFHIANYKKYVKELEKENQELRRTKQRLLDSLEKMGPTTAPTVSPILRQFQERLKDLFKKRRHIRKAQMESEGAKRELKWKVTRKEQSIKRVQHLTGSPTIIGKHRRIIERMNRRIAKEEQALKDSSHSIQEHDTAIYNTYSEINSTLSSGKEALELLELNVCIHTIEANLYDSHMYLAFVKKMARAQERQSSVNERLISCLIQLVKKQHDILHSQDLLNNELISKYEQCCYLVEERGVAWTSPVVDQERPASKHPGDETEDFCISDIIDIQIPKLHVQALQGETTTSKARADGILQQQPQRVLKPMSAVKPAARVAVGQYFSNDKGMKQCSSPVCYTGESGDFSSSQLAAGESLSEKESTLTCMDAAGMNAVEMLNVSLDMCPKRRGFTPAKTENSPQASVSASGISFGADQPLAAENKEEKIDDTKVCEENNQNVNLSPTAEVASNEWKLAEGSRPTSLRRKPSQPQTASMQAETAPEDDENSGTGNMNDTFQILQPVLPNTPCIDHSRRHSFGTSTPQSHGTHSHNPASSRTAKRLSLERAAFSHRLDFGNEGKTDVLTANSPVSRHQSRPLNSNHTPAISWGQNVKSDDKVTNVKHLSDSFIRQGQSKGKLTFLQNKFTANSPVGSSKHSSSSASGRSVVATNPYSGNLNSPTSLGPDEKQKPESAFCVNSNNANSLTACIISPKTYADAVKSPVVARVSTCSYPRLRPTAIVKQWVNETAENVMKTPDFSSNQCMKLVASALKKPVGEAVIISKSASDVTDETERRQPLRVLSTNKSVSRSPVLKPSYSSLGSEMGYGVQKSQLKVRANFASTRQNRAVSSGPYNVQNRYTQRSISGRELPSEQNQAKSCESGSMPGYMQSTFARAQKIMGNGREKQVQLKARVPLSRWTATNRQPLSRYTRI